MILQKPYQLTSAVFITFSGNCKAALMFYQSCFGGHLQVDTFHKVDDFLAFPVVSASLVSERIVIHGSDLVHNEGRTLGNYISIFLYCKNVDDRAKLIDKLICKEQNFRIHRKSNEKLIEITDAFDVRWTLGI